VPKVWVLLVKPTVVSLFAGCGGSSLGYKWAGFRELLVVDFEPHAIETFKLNFPDVDAWQADIRKVTAEVILERTGIEKGELDVLDGSPPCQGFSTAGKRKVVDNRNELPFEFIRLIEGLQPRAFVMENVSGMAKGGMRGLFNEILVKMKATGYHVEVHKLNAMYYGVPQSRERIIFIGMRDGQAIKWPVRQEIITVRDAIGNIENSENELKESGLKKSWQMYRVLTGQEEKKHFSLVRLCNDRPSSAILKDAGNTATGTIHPTELRRLTTTEVAVLMSFPADFIQVGTFKERWARFGNAVPPKMMQAIAECVKEVLEDD